MTKTSQQRLLFAVALAVLAAGVIVTWSSGRGGLDFPSLYAIGRSVIEGTNIYAAGATADFPARYGVSQPQGMFYPPATGFSMLPFALLPYQPAKYAWLVTLDLAMILGIRSLIRFLAPRAGHHVWMACAAVVLLSATVRWGMILLQGAPLLLGLLCWFVVTAHDGRRSLATVIAVIAVAVKMTLALPFVGILALQRRFGAVVAAGGTWVLLNALGFVRMGHGSFQAYRANVAFLESFGNINAPDPWNPVSLPRLDWTSLLYGLTGNLGVARLGSLALAGSVCLFLVWMGLRATHPTSLRNTALFLPPLVCLGSLCVYHHHYDACSFFVPTFLYLFVFGKRLQPRWAIALTLPILTMILFLPIGLGEKVAERALGATGVGLLKLAFPVSVSLFLWASLVFLWQRARLPELEGEAQRQPDV